MESKGKSEDFLKGDSAENLQSTRVWCPGSFDLYHYGHASLLRKAKESGKNVGVVVGLHSDVDLRRMEGEPVFTQEERYEILKGIRWVDDIVRNAPTEFQANLLEEYSCDYAVLGIKDIDRKTRDLIESGDLKLENKCKGISTGSIIHRILSIEDRDENNNSASGKDWGAGDQKEALGFSTQEILQFSTKTAPKPGDKIVYVAGSFDLLHPGHLNLLKKARMLGDFLYVGVHSDDTVKGYAGTKFPVMRSDERLMALLSCKYVSDVIMDAPLKVEKAMMDEFGINIVTSYAGEFLDMEGEENPFYHAKEREIYEELERSEMDLTTEMIVRRVHSNWFEYEDRLARSSSSDFLSRSEPKSIELGIEDLDLKTKAK